MASGGKNLADFCVAPPGWCDCCPGKENDEPLPKKKLSLSLKEGTVDRFDFSIGDAELHEAMKGYCPKNTLQNNKWAVKNFTDWATARNETLPPSEYTKGLPMSNLLKLLDY